MADYIYRGGGAPTPEDRLEAEKRLTAYWKLRAGKLLEALQAAEMREGVDFGAEDFAPLTADQEHEIKWGK
jgi:hypothetical protein